MSFHALQEDSGFPSLEIHTSNYNTALLRTVGPKVLIIDIFGRFTVVGSSLRNECILDYIKQYFIGNEHFQVF